MIEPVTDQVRFRTLFDQTAVGVAMVETKTGRFESINQKFCDFLGYPQEEMLRLSFQDVTYPEDIQADAARNDLLIEGKIRDFAIEKRYLHKDGKIVWGILSVSPLWKADEVPQVYYHFAVVQDISERKQAEEDLRQSEKRFRLLVDNAPLAISVIDLETTEVLYVNPLMAVLFEMPLEELLGSSIRTRYIHLDDRERFRSFLQAQHGITGLEVCMQKGDGREFWAAITSSASSFEGRPSIYTTYTDISERRAAEEALRESEEKFRMLFEGHTAIMLLVEPASGKIVDANPSACRFYGYSRRALLEMNIRDINSIPPEEIKSRMQEVTENQTNHFILPHRLSHGEIRTVEVDSAFIFMRGARVLFSIIRDITEQNRMEADLREAQKMASIGILVAGIAHEMNTPLQVITGYSNSLIRDLKEGGKLEGERPERQLNTLNRNAWRVAEIVRSLQHYAHPNAEQASQADLNELVRDTLILLDHQLKTWENIHIETDLAADLPPFACEPNKIIQVLINLLKNARDAMFEGGAITVSTAYEADGDRLVLKIVDSGLGIPEPVRVRIFEPFFTTKELGQGVGLGLSVVHGIVRAHGGEIQVNSSPGKGTTFVIRLPLTPPVQPFSQTGENGTQATRARYD
jgi:PAS domain S-box-containing protein